MGREEQALATLQEQLADSDLYSEDQRDKLAELLRDEGSCKQRLADLEEQWLALQEELEELESGLD